MTDYYIDIHLLSGEEVRDLGPAASPGGLAHLVANAEKLVNEKAGFADAGPRPLFKMHAEEGGVQRAVTQDEEATFREHLEQALAELE